MARRPGFVLRTHVRPLLAWWLCTLALGAMVGAPLGLTLPAIGSRRHPEGDRLLFARGGDYLLETLHKGSGALGAAARLTGPLVVFASLLALLVLLAFLCRINRPQRSEASTLATEVTRLLPRFASLSALTLLAQAAVLLFASMTAFAPNDSLALSLGERTADLLSLGVFCLALGAGAAFGLVRDLARAVLVVHGVGTIAAVAAALESCVKQPLGLVAVWGMRWLPTATVLLASGSLTARLDVGSPGAWRIALVFGLHQLTILVTLVLQAYFFGWLLRHAATLLRERQL